MNEPGFKEFEALRQFVVLALEIMTSDCAQALFPSNDNLKTH